MAGNPGPRVTDLDKFIGNQLRIHRILRGLSQEKLAQVVGLSFQQVQKYERGKNRISASKLFEICRYLKVPMESFMVRLTHDTQAPVEVDVCHATLEVNKLIHRLSPERRDKALTMLRAAFTP